MTSTTSDDRRPPSDEELRELLLRGRAALDEVDDAHLARIRREVESRLDDGTDHTDARDVGAREVVTTAAVHGRHDTGRRTWRELVPLAAAAVVALLVGVGIGSTLGGDPGTAEPTTLATYELVPLEGAGASATSAELHEQDGTRTVQVDLTDLPRTDGFHEVWLLDPDTGALASLGPVRPDGRYVVPTGTDLARLTALDVSVEPLDGDPTHSGDSVLRGEVVWTG